MQSLLLRRALAPAARASLPSIGLSSQRSVHSARPLFALRKSTTELDKELFGDIAGSDRTEKTERKARKPKEISPNLEALSEKPSAAPSDKAIAANLDKIEKSIFGSEEKKLPMDLAPPSLPRSTFGERSPSSFRERRPFDRSESTDRSDRYGQSRNESTPRGFGKRERDFDSGDKFGGGGSRFPSNGSYDRSRGRSSEGGDRYGDKYSPRSSSRNDGETWGSRLKKPDWEAEKVEMVKTTYEPHPEVAKMTPQEVAEWRKANHFKVEGEGHAPVLNFDHLPVDSRAISFLKDAYSAPTAIQAQSWPIAFGGNDLIGRAQTGLKLLLGSGKTVAFLLPLMEHVKAQIKAGVNLEHGPCAVVLAPTRELALQIHEEVEKLGAVYRIRSAYAHGGQQNRNTQIRLLKRAPAVVVATPGRLIDFIEDGTTSLKQATFVVLDEADRMLDMGFEDQVRSILSQVRPDRQTLMFSATWPREVAGLAKEFLTEPSIISIGSEDLVANPSVKQEVVLCAPFDRIRLLEEVFEKNPTSKILVFAGSKSNCDFLGEHLYKTRRDMKFAVIHGDKSQQQRQNIIEDFKSGYLSTVIATDVAARGLDVKDIDIVVNYEFPPTIEDYIHRIGRTGKTGTSVSFFTPAYHRLVKELINCMRNAKQEVPANVQALVKEQRREGQAQLRTGRSRAFASGRGGKFGGGGGYGGGGFSRGGGSGGGKPRSDSERYGDRYAGKRKE